MTINYVPTVFEHQVNVTKRHPIKTVFVLLATLAFCLTLVHIILGLLIDLVSEKITLKQEKWLWSIMRSSYSINEPLSGELKVLQKHVSRVFNKIPKNNLVRQYPFRVKVLSSHIPNAYALPGGVIIVTSALLEAIDSENTLAFILGHELGHFQNRDHLKHLGRELVLTKILKMFLGDDISGMFAQLTLALDNRYSRQQERKADEWGVKLLVDTYKHAGGASDFFEWIIKSYGDRKFSSFFQTHPSPSSRIKYINKLIEKYDYKIKKVLKRRK